MEYEIYSNEDTHKDGQILFKRGARYFYKGAELFDVFVLQNDFNFFDIEGKYIDLGTGHEKRGKFRLDELTVL